MTLPLPAVRLRARLPRPDSICYALSSIDRWGRLGTRSVLTFLDWDDGLPVTFTVDPATSCLWIRPGTDLGRGSLTIVRQRELRLPAYVRHSCGIGINDRLLLRADRSSPSILAMTPNVVEELLRPHLRSVEGGGDNER